ncbi:hypothetical protein [Pseudosporangium ferrugineum]|uniref:Secreted protein n=1 Tax=Pseudosporangium ferrugineum TaxID=439699 RepID=A0A2T0RIM2_9ACTN|nr:hypothetical protein [Pseudosporangium ferrugineum]PRY21033.1 hypothetical protein CLV70_12134 [Pseudosporangium ferrugineum]
MRRSYALVLAAVAVVALPACGSSKDEAAAPGGGAKVATLQSTAPTPDASASKKPQRPRERLDTTPEEYEALLKPYKQCMGENGVPQKASGRGGPVGAPRPATAAENAKFDKANRICEPLYMPLPPWEKDPANPESRDFAVKVVKCLKGKGVKYVAVAEDGISIALGGDGNDSRSISKGMDKMPECEREVVAAMKD